MIKLASAVPLVLLGCFVMTQANALVQPAQAAPAGEPFENEIRAFEAADKKKMPEPGGVLFLGSSSIQKWSSLQRDFAAFKVINRGFGGSIIEQSTRYAPRIVWPYKPRLIIFYAGDNDLAEGKTPPQVLADFQSLAARVREQLPQTSIAFVSIKPSPARAELKGQAMQANALIRAWIEERREQKLRFIDVWTAMTNDAAQREPSCSGLTSCT